MSAIVSWKMKDLKMSVAVNESSGTWQGWIVPFENADGMDVLYIASLVRSVRQPQDLEKYHGHGESMACTRYPSL